MIKLTTNVSNFQGSFTTQKSVQCAKRSTTWLNTYPESYLSAVTATAPSVSFLSLWRALLCVLIVGRFWLKLEASKTSLSTSRFFISLSEIWTTIRAWASPQGFTIGKKISKFLWRNETAKLIETNQSNSSAIPKIVSCVKTVFKVISIKVNKKRTTKSFLVKRIRNSCKSTKFIMIIETNENKTRDIARFGHTITKLNDKQMLLFGGAVETNRGVYSTTNDSFSICKETLVWTKIQSNLKRPRVSTYKQSCSCCDKYRTGPSVPIRRGLRWRQSCSRDTLLRIL